MFGKTKTIERLNRLVDELQLDNDTLSKIIDEMKHESIINEIKQSESEIDHSRNYHVDMSHVIILAALRLTGLNMNDNAVPVQLCDLAYDLMAIDGKTKPSEAYDCLVKRLEEYKAKLMCEIKKDVANGLI